MLRKIYSKRDPSILLHIIHTYEPHEGPITSIKKQPIADAEHFLQALSFELPAETVIKAHGHNLQQRKTTHTHEALVVFKGSIELSIYDIDKSLLEKQVLKPGDCYMIVNGGHSLRALVPSTVFEFKNGPYTGPENDKTYFN